MSLMVMKAYSAEFKADAVALHLSDPSCSSRARTPPNIVAPVSICRTMSTSTRRSGLRHTRGLREAEPSATDQRPLLGGNLPSDLGGCGHGGPIHRPVPPAPTPAASHRMSSSNSPPGTRAPALRSRVSSESIKFTATVAAGTSSS